MLEQLIHLFHVKCCMNFPAVQMKNTKFILSICIINLLLKIRVWAWHSEKKLKLPRDRAVQYTLVSNWEHICTDFLKQLTFSKQLEKKKTNTVFKWSGELLLQRMWDIRFVQKILKELLDRNEEKVIEGLFYFKFVKE